MSVKSRRCWGRSVTTVFPYAHNWRSPLRETLGYQTEIIVSRSGKEQRRADRISPRRVFEMLVTLPGGRYPAFKQFLAQYRRQEIALPDPTRNVEIASTLDAGDTNFSVAATRSWLVAGASICFLDNGYAEIREVFSVTALAVVLVTPVTRAWSAGFRVRPALLGRLGRELSGSKMTDEVVELTVPFRVTPTSEAEIAVPPAPTTVLGRELLTRTPNFDRVPDIVFLQDEDEVDYGFGQVAFGYPVAFQTRITTATYVGLTRANIQLLKDFFNRARGQQGEFYNATNETDLVAVGVTSAGDATVLVSGSAVASAFATDTVAKALCFTWADGEKAYRAVNGITASSGNSIVTLASALARDIDAGVKISWLLISRFAADDMEINWYTETVADVSWPIKTLENLV